MEDFQNLKNIVAEFDEAINEKVSEFMNEIKNGCKTYEDVNKKMDLFLRNIRWNCGEKLYVVEILISHSRRLLEREKNDLLLTNRPQL